MKMKKLLPLLAAGCLALILCACAGNKAEEKTAEAEVAEPSVTAEAEAEAEREAEAEESGDVTATLSDSEAKALFEEARAVYDLFDLNPLDTDPGDTAEIDGLIGYERVTDAKITTLEQLNAKAESVFSDEIVARLMNDKIYAEENGVLYERIAGRGSDITRGKILSQKITDATETTATYTVTVENIEPDTEQVDGTQEVIYKLEKTGDRWIFTAFEPLY